ncbi:hypothetical protein SBA1_110029 [Candidatus Sulfotelmatobacter kueseliae]|uniref:Uncharacterized protein n=1 Tax=Candidatus Sulfotelmatobacter kueseliae TaxID=2042962 RepID=A0A2U3JZG8_9BACT|nr:hypothetical protein SBA1_110029 [Candidatus Sulfotelmatobacter kueseliae]
MEPETLTRPLLQQTTDVLPGTIQDLTTVLNSIPARSVRHILQAHLAGVNQVQPTRSRSRTDYKCRFLRLAAASRPIGEQLLLSASGHFHSMSEHLAAHLGKIRLVLSIS